MQLVWVSNCGCGVNDVVSVVAVLLSRPMLDSQTFVVDDNKTAGSFAGQMVSNDQDWRTIGGVPRTDPHSFTGFFDSSFPFIVWPNGTITVRASKVLDWDAKPSYTMLVGVCDSGGAARGVPKCRNATMYINLNKIWGPPVVLPWFDFTVTEDPYATEDTPPGYVGFLNATSPVCGLCCTRFDDTRVLCWSRAFVQRMDAVRVGLPLRRTSTTLNTWVTRWCTPSCPGKTRRCSPSTVAPSGPT